MLHLKMIILMTGIQLNKNFSNMSYQSTTGWPRHREFGSYVFPDRENTGNFVITQGKFLRHRENIFDCIHKCKKHVSLHIFKKKNFSLALLGIISTFKYQYICCPSFFLYHICYKYHPNLFRQFYKQIYIM